MKNRRRKAEVLRHYNRLTQERSANARPLFSFSLPSPSSCPTPQGRTPHKDGQLGQKSHFGFFFRKAFEGGTTFGFLIGLVGSVAFSFEAVGLTDGFTGCFGGTFFAGDAFDGFDGSFFTAVTGFAGFLTAGVTGGDLSDTFSVGFASGGVLGGSFGAFAGSFGAFAGGTGLASLTGATAGTGTGIAGCTKGVAANTGVIQLRLTASESIALNCESNSGASGTS